MLLDVDKTIKLETYERNNILSPQAGRDFVKFEKEI